MKMSIKSISLIKLLEFVWIIVYSIFLHTNSNEALGKLWLFFNSRKYKESTKTQRLEKYNAKMKLKIESKD